LTADSAPGARAEWHASRTEHLCTRGSRFVTGRDIVRVSRALALEPWYLTEAAPAAAGDPTGILTDGGRRRVNLRLANGPQGCLFLLRTLRGVGHCGLGELAPVSCRVFPTQLGEGASPASKEPADEALRSSGQEPEHEPGQESEYEKQAEAKRAWAADRDEWFEVVKEWNALPDQSGSRARARSAAGSGDESDIRVFQRYLLETYAAREAKAAKSGEAAS
jgi:hypothetical protein